MLTQESCFEKIDFLENIFGEPKASISLILFLNKNKFYFNNQICLLILNVKINYLC